MNTEQYNNNGVTRQLIQKMFVKFANRYGNLWTSRLGEHGDWKGCEDDWLEELSAFSMSDAVNSIKKALVIYKDFPPTLGQIIDLCLEESGVPRQDEIIKLMIERKFNHPMVKLVYDKVGGWMLSNGKSEEISRKVSSVYSECKAEFICNQEQQWKALEAKQEKFSLPPVENQKVSKPNKLKGFKEYMEEFKRLAEEGAARLKDMKPLEFDEKKIGEEGEQRADYEKYLRSVPDNLVLALPSKYVYDRQRLLIKDHTARYLRECGYIPHEKRGIVDNARSGKNKPYKVYKNWVY